MAERLQHLIATQRRWCKAFDRLLPARCTLDGALQFKQVVTPAYLASAMTVYDVGGGKHPFFEVEKKVRLGLHVCAIDITQDELTVAPAGAYDEVFCADICTFSGNHSADLVVCQAVLEHVSDTRAALRGIASLLKPGAAALVFVPCRNALFARLNMLLPEKWKRRVLFTIFPGTGREHGFPAYYDRCTPRDFIDMAHAAGIRAETVYSYYMSVYFSFFLPAHVLWRIWQLLARYFFGDQVCESFSIVLRKPAEVALPRNHRFV
ncbi:MAG: methyltransferase domain-containing protein [Candidatus Korobacteraceae bacterium]